MSRPQNLLAPAVGLAFLAACAGDIPTETPAGAPNASVAAAAITNLGGDSTWTWSNVEEVAFPPFVAGLLGLMPEGDLTYGRCESAGTLKFEQVGASFTGTALRTSNACVTRGGFPFNQPGTLFLITEGRIAGASVVFSFANPMLTPCPHHTRITAFQDGEVVSLSGTGRCILVGHPLSESPLQADPPPQGKSRTLSWEAVRQ